MADLSPRFQDPAGTAEVIDPLPPVHRRGLIAVGITSLLSTILTTIMLGFLTHRLVFWRKYFNSYIGYNQFIILIYNLLLADFLEALGFLLSLHWVSHGALWKDTPVCTVQGVLLQIGDPASGLFVLVIAVHTFFTVLLGRKIDHRVFVASLVFMWIFCLLLVIVPTGMWGADGYSPTGAWCWIDEKHEPARLWAHYLWIFVSEFGSLVLYAILFFFLRRQVSASTVLRPGQDIHLRRLRRVCGYMVVYPVAYTLVSLPLAAGRMASASGRELSISYFCAAGAIIASSGFVDVMLYAITRRALLVNSQPSYLDRAYDSAQQHNHTASVTADIPHTATGTGTGAKRMFYRRPGDSTFLDGDSSTENIVKDTELSEMGKVYQKTTIEVSHESAPDPDPTNSSPSRSMEAVGSGTPEGTSWYGR